MTTAGKYAAHGLTYDATSRISSADHHLSMSEFGIAWFWDDQRQFAQHACMTLGWATREAAIGQQYDDLLTASSLVRDAITAQRLWIYLQTPDSFAGAADALSAAKAFLADGPNRYLTSQTELWDFQLELINLVASFL